MFSKIQNKELDLLAAYNRKEGPSKSSKVVRLIAIPLSLIVFFGAIYLYLFISNYHLQKQNQKELRKITRRIEQLEAEMEELDKKIQDITETMHSTNDAADLVQLQSELDQLTAQQEAVMEEWAELSEQVE